MVASLWGLYRAQSKLTEVGESEGVRVRYFHGRGGTISRGAGPTGRFVRSIPAGSLAGDLRLTEQGETIAQKYANQNNAIYNLELLLAGTAVATLGRSSTPDERVLKDALEQLADSSRSLYRELLTGEGFVTFFSQATPIDVIEQSRIGSRPARRTGKRSLGDLRAIPWVFSWSQSRFFLSGWYGVGTALAKLRQNSPEQWRQLGEHLYGWAPLHYIISNAATSVMTADLSIMRLYASLVEDPDLRQRVMTRIEAELELSREMLEGLYGGTLAERRAHPARLLAKRQAPLSALHHRQVMLLRRWRKAPTEPALASLLLTVNAIAAGLRTTG